MKRIISRLALALVLSGSMAQVALAEGQLDQQRAELKEVRSQLPELIRTLQQDEQRLIHSKQGLKFSSREAIDSWITAADALDSVADLFQSHLAVHLLKWGHHNLETLSAVRRGIKDPQGLIASEDDLLGYEDAYNFHAVEPGLVYSGSAPSERGMRWLKRKGFTAIVNFRKDDDERLLAKKLGLKYYHLPIPDHLPPTEAQVDQFLKIVATEKAAHGMVYHHCLRGVGRDQTMIACYRLSKGLTAEQAIQEGAKAAPGWLVDQGHAEHGEDASAAEAAKYAKSDTPQFDFIREFERHLKAKH